MFPAAARIDIARLHSGVDGSAIGQKSPQDTGDLGAHRSSLHVSNRLPGLHQVADPRGGQKYAVCRGSQEALHGIAADFTGNARVGGRRSVPEDAAQIVAA